MKKIMLFTIACLLLPGAANSSSIYFNTPTLSGSIQRIDTYTERGVTFRGAFNHVDALSGDASNGTAYMQYDSASSLNFARSDHSLMNLVSIDLAELSSAPVSVTFLAQLSGSEIISQTFTTDGVFGPGNDFQTFFFDSTFTGVQICRSVVTKSFSLYRPWSDRQAT